MKEWRSKHGRISESEIIQYITEDKRSDTYKHFVVGGMLCTTRNKQIFSEMIDNNDLFLSIIQYLETKQINVFDSIEELEDYLDSTRK